MEDIVIKNETFTVVYYEEEKGGYSAAVRELAGCVTQAETLGELREMVIDAIESYVGSFTTIFVKADTLEEFVDEI
jgi:predicted RNase H-like HicB family nuclease